MKAPIATTKSHQTEIHGLTLEDDYYWLREKTNEEVLDYLKAENAYTKGMTEHSRSLEETLYKEMIARIKETDLSVPVRKGDYFYYYRTEEGKNYSINCRKKGSLEAEEEILLDENVLAEGKVYCAVRAFSVSPNHKLLAYSVDFDGSEQPDIYVKNLETGELLKDFIPKTAGSVVWSNDNQTIYYSLLDETRRPYQLYKHQLGTDIEKDSLVFEEADGEYFMYPYKSKSREFIFIESASKITTEIHFLDANDPSSTPQIIQPRIKAMEYEVSHHGDYFYLLTNKDAINFRLMRAPIANPSIEHWEELIPHDEKVLLSSLECFRNHLVLYGRKNGFKNIQIHDFRTQKSHEVSFPEPVYSYWGDSNPDYETNILRFQYTSLISPRGVYDYNMDDRSRELKKEYEVQGGYTKENYLTERLEAQAEDGTMIPMSIVYKKGMKKDGTSPCLLYGYGSYGSSMDPYFSISRLSLLDRGFVFAIAHVRGGSEMGRLWYENGKYLHKKNTFTDFISCAECLIENKFASKETLGAMGGSAGGLLMGAITNLRPDLFKAIISAVPFVDVINTMLDDTIPLTVVEYEEWGNPNDKVYFDYMHSYSPYDNLKPGAYPHILITAGLNDPRVQYWEPAKYTAKLRTLKNDDTVLLLKTNMGAGHGGASGRYEMFKEIAFEYAFLIDRLAGLE